MLDLDLRRSPVPTYQYACTEADCGHAFEQVQSFSDDALTVCPQCEGRLRKVFNAVGVVFKGSGFYRTDSRQGADKSHLERPSSPDKGAGSSGSTTNGSTSTSGSGRLDLDHLQRLLDDLECRCRLRRTLRRRSRSSPSQRPRPRDPRGCAGRSTPASR